MKTNPKSIISMKYDDMFHAVFTHENVRKQFLSDVLEIPLESIRTARLVTPDCGRGTAVRSWEFWILPWRWATTQRSMWSCRSGCSSNG